MRKLQADEIQGMEYMLYRLKRRSVAAGDCWEWIGQKTHGLTPVMRYRHLGQWTSMPVRRAILIAQGACVAGKRAVAACGNKLCVNPDHVGVEA